MKDFFVICDNIRSLENIGSIFRTADAVGVTKIFLCGISGKPPQPEFAALPGNPAVLNQKISKTALGAEKDIPFEYHKQTGRLIELLKKNYVTVVALEQGKHSLSYTKFKPTFPLALMVGNEVKGISNNILKKVDHIISLPMHGKKESLNVSVAFGVAAYEIIKKRT